MLGMICYQAQWRKQPGTGKGRQACWSKSCKAWKYFAPLFIDGDGNCGDNDDDGHGHGHGHGDGDGEYVDDNDGDTLLVSSWKSSNTVEHRLAGQQVSGSVSIEYSWTIMVKSY